MKRIRVAGDSPAAKPAGVKLPPEATVTIRTRARLSGNFQDEQVVDVTYSLEDGHDVFFRTSNGSEKVITIPEAGELRTTCRTLKHTLTLIEDPAGTAMANLPIGVTLATSKPTEYPPTTRTVVLTVEQGVVSEGSVL